ncbi:MAG: RraA family protein [Rhodobacteraceae bacterium]|nr:RraA family protein [Paracoccaceae bacterium]
MTGKLFAALRRVDTPTICNAVEVAMRRRGFDNYTKAQMCSTPELTEPIIGFALTAHIRAKSPPAESAESIRVKRMQYYDYVAGHQRRPSVIVIEDLDADAACGAYWGEVNATLHKAFGLKGAITNGVVRDLGALPADFPILAGSVGVSHAHVRVVDIAKPVSIFGMSVTPGDLIHADQHGALVIPADLLPELPDAIDRLESAESLILDAARHAENFGFAEFKAAWQRFEDARI